MAITAPDHPHRRVLPGGTAPYLSGFNRSVRRSFAHNRFHLLTQDEEPLLCQALTLPAPSHSVSSGLVRWYTGDQYKTPLPPATVATTVTR